jgi:hypothetical protein
VAVAAVEEIHLTSQLPADLAAEQELVRQHLDLQLLVKALMAALHSWVLQMLPVAAVELLP